MLLLAKTQFSGDATQPPTNPENTLSVSVYFSTSLDHASQIVVPRSTPRSWLSQGIILSMVVLGQIHDTVKYHSLNLIWEHGGGRSSQDGTVGKTYVPVSSRLYQSKSELELRVPQYLSKPSSPRASIIRIISLATNAVPIREPVEFIAA